MAAAMILVVTTLVALSCCTVQSRYSPPHIYQVNGNQQIHAMAPGIVTGSTTPTEAVDALSRGVGIDSTSTLNAFGIITRSVIIQDSDSQGFDLIQKTMKGFELFSGCAQTDCVNGVVVKNEFDQCKCVCYNSRWIGAACDLHDCFGNGVYNVTSRLCDCRESENYVYLSWSMCSAKVMKTDLGPIQTGCHNGEFGGLCQHRCGTDEIANTSCAWRENWMHDECIEISSETSVCFCGAIFDPRARNNVEVKYIVCSTLDDCVLSFKSTSHICCSPHIDCSVNSVTKCSATDSLCCRDGNSDPLLCERSGCIHNGAYCLPLIRRYISMHEILSNQRWYRFSRKCQYTEPNSICRLILRYDYLTIASRCSLTDTDCLREIRVTLNDFPFTEASVTIRRRNLIQARMTHVASVKTRHFLPRTNGLSELIAELPYTGTHEFSPVRIEQGSLYNYSPQSVKFMMMALKDGDYYCVMFAPWIPGVASVRLTVINLSKLEGYILPLHVCAQFPFYDSEYQITFRLVSSL